MTAPTFMPVRSRATRWATLRDLAAKLEALCAHNAGIDALDGMPREKVAEIAAFEQQLEHTQSRIHREIVRLQVDRLQADLAAKKRGR